MREMFSQYAVTQAAALAAVNSQSAESTRSREADTSSGKTGNSSDRGGQGVRGSQNSGNGKEKERDIDKSKSNECGPEKTGGDSSGREGQRTRTGDQLFKSQRSCQIYEIQYRRR